MASIPGTKDKDWVNSSFMIIGGNLNALDLENRFFSTASMKFSDTTPGGNFAINPPPQFTRAADPKADSLVYPGMEHPEPMDSFSINNMSRMGRYYSEAIDDNSQLINMRFGVPKFNSLINFFSSFYNSGAGRLARTGRMNDALYSIGRAAGVAMQIYAPPLLYIHVANFLGTGVRFMMGKPSSKFYYLKPTMPLYWNAVTTIVNHISVLKSITPRVGDPATEGMNHKLEVPDRLGLVANDREYFSKIMPDVFDKDGNVNVYGLATRAQRKYRKFRQAVQNNIDKDFNGVTGVAAIIKSVLSTPLTDQSRELRPTLQTYVEKWMKNGEGTTTYTGNPTTAAPQTATTNNSTNGPVTAPATSSYTGEKSTEAVEKIPDYKTDESGKPIGDDGFLKFFEAELDDGSAFVTFRVNHTGSINESFSNQVGESEISSTINGISSKSRSTNFSMAEGNVAGIMTSVIEGAKDFTAGVADQLGISGIVALAGGAFVDIPKHWQSSAAQLPRSTYTINLGSPYGNKLSRFLNIDIPLAMILAGALPLSTGKQSYTSPFLCEIYDQGRCQTRLGMIDSLSITRGTGNLGFNNQGQAMGIEISFSVVDMSSIMHMPIVEGFSLNPATAFFDEDTVFSDYMASLAGIGLADQIYPWKKLKINISKQMRHWDTFFSWSHTANWLGGTTPALLLSAFYKGQPR